MWSEDRHEEGEDGDALHRSHRSDLVSELTVSSRKHF